MPNITGATVLKSTVQCSSSHHLWARPHPEPCHRSEVCHRCFVIISLRCKSPVTALARIGAGAQHHKLPALDSNQLCPHLSPPAPFSPPAPLSPPRAGQARTSPLQPLCPALLDPRLAHPHSTRCQSNHSISQTLSVRSGRAWHSTAAVQHYSRLLPIKALRRKDCCRPALQSFVSDQSPSS